MGPGVTKKFGALHPSPPPRKKRKKLNKRMMETDEVTIHSLPEEMLIQIFSHLTHNELGQVTRVCRKWKELARSPVLWKSVDVRFIPRHGSQSNVVRQLLKNLSPCTSCIKLDFSHNCNWKLPFNFKRLSSAFHRACPNLEILAIHKALFTCSLSSFIHLCARFLPNIRILCFVLCEFTYWPAEIKYDTVSKIEVLSVRRCENLNKGPFSKMPFLKELHLAGSMALVNYWMKRDNTFWSRLEILTLAGVYSIAFQAMSHMALNLVELYVCHSCITDKDFNFRDPTNVFPRLKVICVKQVDKRVTMSGVISIIRSCPCLQKMYLLDKIWDDAAYAQQPFAKNHQLEIIKVNCESQCGPHDKKTHYLNK